VQEYSELGGYLSPSMGIKFSEVPNGLVAFSKILLAGWPQIVAFCDLVESTGFTFTQRKCIGRMTSKSNNVLANGRLAIMEIIRIFFQDGLTGSAWGDFCALHELASEGLWGQDGLVVARRLLGSARICDERQQGE